MRSLIHRFYTKGGLCAAALALALLSAPFAVRAETPRVVADIAPVHALAARVMQGVGVPELLVSSDASPHHATLRPSQARALAQADLIVWIGPELTPALGRALETLGSDASQLRLAEQPGTVRLALRGGTSFAAHAHDGHDGHDDVSDHGEHSDHGNHDEHGDHSDDPDHYSNQEGYDHGRHHGQAGHDNSHDHGMPDADTSTGMQHQMQGALDPHAWLDPVNAALWLSAVADRLADLDPANAAAYRANAAAGQAELAALSDEIAAAVAPLRDRPVVLFHDATQYFESRFGVVAAGALAEGDGSAPGPARLAEIRVLIAQSDAACLIAEPQHDTALVRRLSDATDVPAVTLDPLGAGLQPGPDLYPQLMRGIAAALADCG